MDVPLSSLSDKHLRFSVKKSYFNPKKGKKEKKKNQVEHVYSVQHAQKKVKQQKKNYLFFVGDMRFHVE